MLKFRPYKSATKEVTAVRITAENIAEVATLAGHGYVFVNDKLYKQTSEGDREVPIGDYLLCEDGKYYTDSDGTFRNFYCPTDIPEEDQQMWKYCSTVVKRNYDTAEEAIAYTKKVLGKE